jgi:hypothetical protein
MRLLVFHRAVLVFASGPRPTIPHTVFFLLRSSYSFSYRRPCSAPLLSPPPPPLVAAKPHLLFPRRNRMRSSPAPHAATTPSSLNCHLRWSSAALERPPHNNDHPNPNPNSTAMSTLTPRTLAPPTLSSRARLPSSSRVVGVFSAAAPSGCNIVTDTVSLVNLQSPPRRTG